MIDDSFKKKVVALKDLGFVGLADIGGRAISAVFWFYIVTLMSATEYGLLNYYVGIASLAQLISLVGTTNALTVFVSKGIKIQSTFFVISLIASSISAIILFVIFGISKGLIFAKYGLTIIDTSLPTLMCPILENVEAEL